MYGYSTFLVSRGLYDQRSALPERSPYRFEPGEPDDAEARTAVKGGTFAVLAAYLLVVALLAAALWVGGGNQPVTEQARRGTDCVKSALWSGCLPTK